MQYSKKARQLVVKSVRFYMPNAAFKACVPVAFSNHSNCCSERCPGVSLKQARVKKDINNKIIIN